MALQGSACASPGQGEQPHFAPVRPNDLSTASIAAYDDGGMLLEHLSHRQTRPSSPDQPVLARPSRCAFLVGCMRCYLQCVVGRACLAQSDLRHGAQLALRQHQLHVQPELRAGRKADHRHRELARLQLPPARAARRASVPVVSHKLSQDVRACAAAELAAPPPGATSCLAQACLCTTS